jgi:calcium-dependent protein kinase
VIPTSFHLLRQLGVAVFTLLSGYEPFAGDDIQHIIEANKMAIFDFDGVEWRHVSDEAKDFVRRAMSVSPQHRLSVHEALDHPWLAEYGGTLNYPPRYASSSNHNHKKCTIS